MSTPAAQSTRCESQDSLLGENDSAKEPNLSQIKKSEILSPRSISKTRGKSFDSLLGETDNNTSITTNSFHQDSKSRSKLTTRGESFDSLLENSYRNINNKSISNNIK